MQRWIVIAAVVLCLVGAGGLAAAWTYRQNKPDKMYLPLPLDAKASAENRKRLVEELRRKLASEEVLTAIARDCGAQAKFKLGSEQEAVAELGRRIYIEDSGTTVNVGFQGKRKERALLGELAGRLGEELRKLLTAESKAAPQKDPSDF